MNIMPQQMEMFVASQMAESLGGSDRLMEMILERRNMFRALTQVLANKGAPGVDGMTVSQLEGFLKRRWPKIRLSLLYGKYRPLPVRRKEIDKPDGGIRLLGIPTVMDRLIQQAIAQIVEQVWDPTFSEVSYGFRPGRSQHDAVRRAKSYLLEGYSYVVDMDLSKFFDRVNHDRLMSRLATKIRDKRVLRLIRRYLTAGTMIDGIVCHSDEGTPQGGPLSPLLSNIVLDELDKELEKRGHRFVRYADDFMIYCKSQKAAERVKGSITKFLIVKLKLRAVNIFPRRSSDRKAHRVTADTAPESCSRPRGRRRRGRGARGRYSRSACILCPGRHASDNTSGSRERCGRQKSFPNVRRRAGREWGPRICRGRP